MSGHPEEGYVGPARLRAGDQGPPLEVQVTLRGMFQPIDGRYHWYGRVDAAPDVDPLGRAGAHVVLSTPEGAAEGRLSDRDPWGRYRIAGTGRPPFVIQA